jgi:arylsulfatase A-like enzyme
MNNILLLSKEILRPKEYLSCYGSTQYNTPNIDKLADLGTKFTNFYTAAPSSAMSFTSMFSGLYPFETKRKSYKVVNKFSQCQTMSDILSKKGYEIHVIFGSKWFRTSHKRSRVFCPTTNYHPLENIHQQVGTHYNKGSKVTVKSNAKPLEIIYNEINDIFKNATKPIFIWLHCPHVFAGRTGYGSDIDLFDKLVGRLFHFFKYNEIFLTADHGHMNCDKGITVYGSHVYEGAIRIPLITPNNYGNKIVSDLLTNTQLKNIIINNTFDTQKYIYSDSQYYLQEDRKLMIRLGDFKYIYNKRNKSEELFDLKFDPKENVNLLLNSIYNRNRQKNYFLDEIYFYPRWSEAKEAYLELRNEKDRLWKDGKLFEKILFKIKDMKSKKFANLYKYFIKKRVIDGKWNSKAQQLFYEK